MQRVSIEQAVVHDGYDNHSGDAGGEPTHPAPLTAALPGGVSAKGQQEHDEQILGGGGGARGETGEQEGAGRGHLAPQAWGFEEGVGPEGPEGRDGV